ncbi:MAG: hypothetical protein ACJARS_005195 [bacterium]|jgi:hypothetical protein
MSSNPFEAPNDIAPLKAPGKPRWRPEARDAVYLAGMLLSGVGVFRSSPEIVIAGMTLGSAATWVKRRTKTGDEA